MMELKVLTNRRVDPGGFPMRCLLASSTGSGCQVAAAYRTGQRQSLAHRRPFRCRIDSQTFPSRRHRSFCVRVWRPSRCGVVVLLLLL